MVIHFEWHRTAMEQKSWSTLPLTGEDTGLEALASPLVGYLGKVQQRASSLEFCPWCSSKGMTYGLHLYRINLQESITLCTNPECLFPLVSQPLEDVLASLVPKECPIRGKRRLPAAVDQEELINLAHKRLRSDEPDAPIVQEEHSATNGNSSKLSEKDPRDSLVTTELNSLQNENAALGPSACEDVPALAPCSARTEPQQSSPTLSTTDVELICSPNDCTSPGNGVFHLSQGQSRRSPQDPVQTFHANSKVTTAALQLTTNTWNASQQSTGASILLSAEAQGVTSPPHQSSLVTATQSSEFVSFPDKLFWSNGNNLCWLDSMLVALVNCEGLRKRRPQDQPRESSVWQLIQEHEAVCAAVQVLQQPGRDGTMSVPQDALQKAHQDLHRLRMSVFKLLQPKLQCKLGQRETPVFALPLLLAMDLWAEPLFQLTFQWEFTCSGCQFVTRESVTKTLPTLTNILPEWSPLNAVHFASCNACGRKNQRRALVLQRAPPVLALHFVQGLPDNNVGKYAFTFKGMDYRITTVIQYNVRLRHFVTWVACSDGSWLEFDGLKHPEWKSHQTFPVQAEEMHVVFWEGEQTRGPPAPGSSQLETRVNGSHADVSEEPTEQSLLLPHDDTDIVCALAAEDDAGSSTAGPSAFADTSIGSTTLLDAFEGLSHDDIVTLTLVEIAAPSSEPLAKATEWIPDTSWEAGPGRATGSVLAEHVAASDTTGYDCSADQPAPALSSAPAAPALSPLSALAPSPSPPPAPLSAPAAAPPPSSAPTAATTPSTSSAPASLPSTAPAPSPAPSPAPALRRGRSRNKAASSDAAKDTLPLTDLPAESLLQTSPLSSINPPVSSHPSPPPASTPPPQAAAPATPTLPLASRWSFLLSRNPKRAANSLAAANVSSPATALSNRSLPAHSTPDPVRRATPIFVKPPPPPPAKLESSDGLLLKAAEMYDGFGAKSSQSRQRPLQPELPAGRPSQPLASLHHQPASAPVAACATSLLETSLKKRHSSKVPLGLSEKEAQRYKQMKKLKAMKKKLAKLNQLLGHQERPDSTGNGTGSPATVTSSTYEGSISEDLLLDLLSPATTASNLSPDSSGYLELFTTGQEGGEQPDAGAAPTPQADNTHPTENFLEDFLSQAVTQRPTEIEAEMLSALDLFV